MYYACNIFCLNEEKILFLQIIMFKDHLFINKNFNLFIFFYYNNTKLYYFCVIKKIRYI